MRNKIKILWGIFFLNVIIICVNIFGTYLGLGVREGSIVSVLVVVLQIILIITHAFWTLSFYRAIFFILLSSSIGFIAEFLGLHYGIIFGGQYFYPPGNFLIFDVPLLVIIFWTVFTYTGYCIVTSFLYWLGQNKPSIHNKKNNVLPFLILADGFVVLAIDLFMDPIQAKLGDWVWLDSGPYFGIPTGNFTGWFFVTMTIVGVFRLFEYFFPEKENPTELQKSALMIPVLRYGLMAFSFTFSAIKLHMNNVLIIGLLLMLPIVILNIVLRKLYLNKYNRRQVIE